MNKINEKIGRHRNFLKFEETDRPLIGFYIGGWEGFSRYLDKPQNLFHKGLINCEDIKTDKFYEFYKNYSKNLFYDDDFIRTLEPVPSIPWAEAACGCPVYFTGQNFWSLKIGFKKTEEEINNVIIEDNPWIKTYEKFIKFLADEFPQFPVGQSILRGPLDVMCAMVGEVETVYNLYDRPGFIKKGLNIFADIFNRFIYVQNKHIPIYCDGYGIGQFYLWTPQKVSRIQEDAMALISPGHYEQYLYSTDVKITSQTPYNLYHIHATGMFLINKIIANKNINIVQISKDEGNTKIEDLLDGLKKIQNAGKSVLIKGRFTTDDIDIIRKNIDKRGLALGCVVDNPKEADQLKEYLFNLSW